MNLYHLIDYKIESVLNNKYDYAFFSSGYESRCFHFPDVVNDENIGRCFVFGFEEFLDSEKRIVNDKSFYDKFGVTPCIIKSSDDSSIYELLRSIDYGGKKRIRLLIDYSGMSRTWYAAILNYYKYTNIFDEVIIDFIYCVGTHQIDRLPISVINDIVCIPGCEGLGYTTATSVAIFGLGFDGFTPLTLLDKLEPASVFAFVAEPGAYSDYPLIAKEANKELINKHINEKNLLKFSLYSVESCYRGIAEVVSPLISINRVILIPLGPKPHILSSILTSMKFPQISCLYVRGQKDYPEDVSASGEYVCTNVLFRN